MYINTLQLTASSMENTQNMIFSPLISFKLLLFVSLLVSMSANSSFILWFSMELNMVAFLPLICLTMGSSLEVGLKYFLIQSMGSMLFLFFIIYNSYMIFSGPAILLVMALKLGSAPFHNWFVSVVSSVSIYMYFLLATVQKMIPVLVVSTMHFSEAAMFFIVFFNVTTIFINLSLMGIMSILAFSSVNSINWMVLSVYHSAELFILFFMVYSLLIFGLMTLNSGGNNSYLSLLSSHSMEKLNTLYIFLSLGGVPPFLGFIIKLMVIKAAMLWINSLLMLSILLGSFMVLFMYLSYSYVGLSHFPFFGRLKPSNLKMFLKSAYFMFTLIIWTSLLFVM